MQLWALGRGKARKGAAGTASVSDALSVGSVPLAISGACLVKPVSICPVAALNNGTWESRGKVSLMLQNF